MKKQLPINTKPILACYGYESYNDAIASSDLYVSDCVALIDNICINGKSSAENPFAFQSDSLTFSNNNGVYEFKSVSPALKTFGILYMNVSGNIDLSFCVRHHLYTMPWSYIAAFAANSLDELEEEYIRTTQSPYLLGYFKKTGFNKNIGIEFDHMNITTESNGSYWLRIKKCHQNIYSYISVNGEDWIEYGCDTTDIAEDCCIGICIDTKEYSYYNWLYSNHLQIYCCEKLSDNCVPIDYFFPVDATGSTRISPFVTENSIPCCLVDLLGIDIVQLVHCCIDNNMCVDVCLNEKYIENRFAYGRYDYYHFNMIFGYDDSNNTVQIFGYDSQSKASASVVKYDDFLKAFSRSNKSDIIIRRHEMSCFHEELNIKLIRNHLEDYIESKDSSWRYPGICQKRKDCCFGLSVYDCILKNESNFNRFLRDLRIVYFLAEHKRIMMQRVKYLADRNVICKDFSESLINQSKKLFDTATTLLMLTMKYKMTKDKRLIDRITLLVEVATLLTRILYVDWLIKYQNVNNICQNLLIYLNKIVRHYN